MLVKYWWGWGWCSEREVKGLLYWRLLCWWLLSENIWCGEVLCVWGGFCRWLICWRLIWWKMHVGGVGGDATVLNAAVVRVVMLGALVWLIAVIEGSILKRWWRMVFVGVIGYFVGPMRLYHAWTRDWGTVWLCN